MRGLVACAVIAVVAAPRIASARPKTCIDTTAIVGREKCSRFGDWSRDASSLGLTFDLGYEYRSFVATPLADHEISASSVSLRVVDRIDHLLYAGGDVAMGGIDGVISTQTSYEQVHAILGARVVLFRLGLAIELAAGGRFASTAATTDSRFAVEARARAEWFVVPYVSVAVTYGHSLIDRDDHMVMVSLGVHTRVMDGSYSPL